MTPTRAPKSAPQPGRKPLPQISQMDHSIVTSRRQA